jgi:hypothetical protein
MTDYIGQHQVTRDYYKEAKLAAAVPMDCPYCKRRGYFAANAYELAKRIPTVMTEGIAFCHICKDIVMRREQVTSQQRAWYCGYCEICICPTCQKTRRGP